MGFWRTLLARSSASPWSIFFREKVWCLPCRCRRDVDPYLVWYSRKVGIQVPSMTASRWAGSRRSLEARPRIHVEWLDNDGGRLCGRITLLTVGRFAATGFVSICLDLGGLYVGFILQAMAATLPRLTASAMTYRVQPPGERTSASRPVVSGPGS